MIFLTRCVGRTTASAITASLSICLLSAEIVRNSRNTRAWWASARPLCNTLCSASIAGPMPFLQLNLPLSYRYGPVAARSRPSSPSFLKWPTAPSKSAKLTAFRSTYMSQNKQRSRSWKRSLGVWARAEGQSLTRTVKDWPHLKMLSLMSDIAVQSQQLDTTIIPMIFC